MLPVTEVAAGVVHLAGGHALGLETLGVSAAQAQAAKTLGVRPEAWEVGPAGGTGLPGLIDFVEHLGDSVIAHVKVQGFPHLLSVKASAQAVTARVGESVSLAPKLGEVLVFDATQARV